MDKDFLEGSIGVDYNAWMIINSEPYCDIEDILAYPNLSLDTNIICYDVDFGTLYGSVELNTENTGNFQVYVGSKELTRVVRGG